MSENVPYLRAVSEAGRTHLLFAALVVHWPFAEPCKHMWEPWGSDVRSQLFERKLRFVGALHPLVDGALRYRVVAAGALCAFRLPLLPSDGLPGVEVRAETPVPGSGEAECADQAKQASPAAQTRQANEAAQVGEAVRHLVEGLPKGRAQPDSASTETPPSAALPVSPVDNV